ncbi:MAG: hypothetical protein OEX22_02530 [Cyclobacteriaceae bacterium]|nr:hypothetical protein [Cyclobacteriaceae bacterium]
MDLKTFVKVNSVTNLSDARYCAGMGVHQIGFCLDEKNKNHITSETIKAITGWISGVEIVSEVEQYQENLPTDAVEVHSLINIDRFNNVKLNVRMSLEEAETKINTLKELTNLDYLLLVNNDENNLQIDRINKLALQVPIVLGDGFNSTTINHLLGKLNIKGIALNGTDEIRPGFKDYDQLADVLEAIEIV